MWCAKSRTRSSSSTPRARGSPAARGACAPRAIAATRAEPHRARIPRTARTEATPAGPGSFVAARQRVSAYADASEGRVPESRAALERVVAYCDGVQRLLRAQCDALVQTMGFPEAIRSENEGGVARVPGRLADPGDGLRRPRRVPRGAPPPTRRPNPALRFTKAPKAPTKDPPPRLRRPPPGTPRRVGPTTTTTERRRRPRVRREKKKPSKNTQKKKRVTFSDVRDASVPHPVHARVCVPGVPAAASTRALRGPHGLGRGRPSAVPGGERARRGRRSPRASGTHAVLAAVGRRRATGPSRRGSRRRSRRRSSPGPSRGRTSSRPSRRAWCASRKRRSSKKLKEAESRSRTNAAAFVERFGGALGLGGAFAEQAMRALCLYQAPGLRHARASRARGAAVGSERSARKESYADARRASAPPLARARLPSSRR